MLPRWSHPHLQLHLLLSYADDSLITSNNTDSNIQLHIIIFTSCPLHISASIYQIKLLSIHLLFCISLWFMEIPSTYFFKKGNLSHLSHFFFLKTYTQVNKFTWLNPKCNSMCSSLVTCKVTTSLSPRTSTLYYMYLHLWEVTWAAH